MTENKVRPGDEYVTYLQNKMMLEKLTQYMMELAPVGAKPEVQAKIMEITLLINKHREEMNEAAKKYNERIAAMQSLIDEAQDYLQAETVTISSIASAFICIISLLPMLINLTPLEESPNG